MDLKRISEQVEADGALPTTSQGSAPASVLESLQPILGNREIRHDKDSPKEMTPEVHFPGIVVASEPVSVGWEAKAADVHVEPSREADRAERDGAVTNGPQAQNKAKPLAPSALLDLDFLNDDQAMIDEIKALSEENRRLRGLFTAKLNEQNRRMSAVLRRLR